MLPPASESTPGPARGAREAAGDRFFVRALGVDQVLAFAGPPIDLRSPSEFAEDHLPGAVNVPLFDDQERALVGTLYRQVGPEEAHREGLRLTRAKVADLVERIAGRSGRALDRAHLEAEVEAIGRGGVTAMEARLTARTDPSGPAPVHVLCCWRGGLRSRSVAALLEALGIGPVAVLAGGYKAYRQHVVRALSAWRPPPAFVLRGLTGAGKTLVLRALEAHRPGWTVDLEALAGHRSSILGRVGLQPRSQKAFDSALWTRMRAGFPAGLVVYEGESRKVGDIVLPERLWTNLEGGVSIALEAPLERRVEVLLDDYLATEGAREALRPGLAFLETRLGRNRYRGVLTGLLEAGRDAELCELLLLRYYDPLYLHSEGKRALAVGFDSSDPEAAARAVAEWIEGPGARYAGLRPAP